MVDRVGIEFQLRENLTAQLRTMLPLMTTLTSKTKEMEGLLYQAKGVKQIKQHLDAMARSLRTVDTASKTLTNTYRNIDRIGQSSMGATKGINTLGRAFGTLAMQLGPILGVYKAIQGLGAMAGEGLNFQNQVVGLSTTGLSGAQQKGIVNQSLALGASGKYILSGGQFVEAARGVLPVLGADRVQGALPEIGKFVTAARRSGVEMSPEILARFWELYGQRTDKDRGKFDESLLKTLQFSKIDPGQLLYQSNIAGGSLLGQDPITAMKQLAFFVKESGAGIGGGGGGGRGRAGFMMQSLDRMISQGKVPVQTLQMWKQLGWLPGIDKYLKSGSRGHSYMIEDGTGQHILHGHGASMADSSKVTATAAREYFLKEQPPWLAAAGKDESLFARQMVLGAGQIAGLKGTPAEVISKFAKLPDSQQKHLLSAITGGTTLSNTAVVQMAAGRYKTSFDIMQQGIDKAPGFAAGAGAVSAQQQWEQIMAQFKTFSDSLGANADVTRALSNILTTMSSTVGMLNDNLKPIAASLAGILNILDFIFKMGQGTVGGAAGIFKPDFWNRPTSFGGDMSATAGALFPSSGSGGVVDNARHFMRNTWKGLQQGSNTAMGNIARGPMAGIITDAAKRYGVDPDLMMAIAQQESGMNPFSVGDHGTSFGLFQLHKGGALGKMSPMDAFNPWNNANNTASRLRAMHGHYSSPGALAAALQRPANPAAYAQSVDKIYVTVHNNTTLDGKKIAEHTATHVEKRQRKAAVKMSYANSGKPGGAYTDSVHNAGASQ